MARMDTTRDAGRSEASMLGIYLNDHLAGATAGTELAHRMARSHGDGQDSGTLRRVAAEVGQDRAALLDIMAVLGVKVRRYKVGAAWLGTVVGQENIGYGIPAGPYGVIDQRQDDCRPWGGARGRHG